MFLFFFFCFLQGITLPLSCAPCNNYKISRRCMSFANQQSVTLQTKIQTNPSNSIIYETANTHLPSFEYPRSFIVSFTALGERKSLVLVSREILPMTYSLAGHRDSRRTPMATRIIIVGAIRCIARAGFKIEGEGRERLSRLTRSNSINYPVVDASE